MVRLVYGDEGIERWHETQKDKSRINREARELIGDERFKARLGGER